MRTFEAGRRAPQGRQSAGIRPPIQTVRRSYAQLADSHKTLEGLSSGTWPTHALAPHPSRHALEQEADSAADVALVGADRSGDSERIVGPALSPEQRVRFEALYNFDFSAVRVHADPEAHALTEQLGARAFTAGSHIVLGANASLRTLAHELAHVVQQGGGAPLVGKGSLPLVRPTASAPAVQFDLAVEPPNPIAIAAPLTPAQIAAAIRFNQRRMSDPYVFAVIRDVMGVSRFPAVVDADFVQAIAAWQAQFNLPVNGMLNERTVTTVVTELRAESAVVPSLAGDADRVELQAALTFNDALGLDARTLRIVQGLLGTPATGSWNDATVRALMARQRTERLHPDGMLRAATLRPLILQLTGAARFDDAIHVIVDAHSFPTANLAAITFDATVVGADAITVGPIATGQPQTVRVGPSTFAERYEHMIRIIGHELQHVQQRSGPVPIANQRVREFLAFAWEALATDSPALAAADRVGHANIAITHWNAAPAADRAAHQGVRDRLELLIAAAGVGNF